MIKEDWEVKPVTLKDGSLGTRVSVRVRLGSDGKIVEVNHPAGYEPDAEGIMQKISLLKLVAVDATVEGVGVRVSKDVFYLRFYGDEITYPNY